MASITESAPQDDETQFWFQWDYFEEARAANVTKAMSAGTSVRIDNPDDAPRIAKAIDDDVRQLSVIETKTETESAFAAGWVKQFGNIEFLILTHRRRRLLHAAPGHRKYDGHLRP